MLKFETSNPINASLIFIQFIINKTKIKEILHKYENYYIFRESSINKFSIILDIYTIELPQFIEKYNSATVQEKVALNIQKFIQAVNSKDYDYAYNCLSQEFRSKYFSNLETFTTYIENNFFRKNTLEYGSFSEITGLYKYDVSLIDTTNEKSNKIQKNFIMKLNQETDFKISFNI